jgi:hypothetical protein
MLRSELVRLVNASHSGLEEIDLIMAKSHASGESPVSIAASMPHKDAEKARAELADALEGDGAEDADESRPLLSGPEGRNYSS